MRWNESGIWKSVKFRIALWYAGLFACSFLVIFLIVGAYWRIGNLKLIDRELAEWVDRLGFEYLCGTAFPEDFQLMDPSGDRADGLTALVRRKMPDFEPILALSNPGTPRRWLMIGADGRRWLRVEFAEGDSEPRILEFTRPADSEHAIKELTGPEAGKGRRRNYFWICDWNGGGLVGTGIPEVERKAFSRFQYHSTYGCIQYATIREARHRIRIAYRVLPGGRIVAAGSNLHNIDSGMEQMITVFALVGVAVLVLSSVGGWLIAWRVFRDVETVSAAAEAIAHGDYSLRVAPSSAGSEVNRLMTNFNTMIGNTEALMTELRTISDNIAHDLRTPLTRMLGRAEVTVTGEPDLESYADAFAANAEECRRMLALVNTMLDIARTESGTARLHCENFDLSTQLRQAVELFTMLAEQNQQHLSCRTPDMPLMIRADRVKIQQVIANLLDNALKFTPGAGTIHAELTREPGWAVLTVRDSGCGMNLEEQSRVFKRFYRADSSRNLPGNGLGLSLVRAIVHAHGGTIALASKPGCGSIFTVRIPLSSDNMNKK